MASLYEEILQEGRGQKPWSIMGAGELHTVNNKHCRVFQASHLDASKRPFIESFVAISCNLCFHKEIFRPPGKQKNPWRKKKGEAQALFQTYFSYQTFQKGSLTQVLSFVCVAFCCARNKCFLVGEKCIGSVRGRFSQMRCFQAFMML